MSIRRAAHLVARNWLFATAFCLGAALRLITMLGFPPAIWFGGDSVSYVNSGLHWWPGVSRESGYGVMLEILQPLHSFAVVTAVQHLMGLAMSVMIYALLRHRYRLPAWGATLAALPVLLDVYVIQLEQEILADSAFAFLCLAAITLVLWWPDRQRPGWSLPAAAALLAIASTFWPVGLPLLVVLLVYLAVRRFGWRAIVATVVGGAVPLLLYAGWFDVRYHQFAFNRSDGIYLWSRTMSFADCSVIRPPADLRPLCPSGPPSSRPPAPYYIWEANSPLLKIGGPGTDKFSSERNALASSFAYRAIEAQPLSYANVVFRGWLLTFTWNRPDVPSASMAQRYQFTDATQTQNTMAGSSSTAITAAVAALHRVQRQYTGGHTADTRDVQPFANIMIDYQKVMYVRGSMLAVLLLVGLGGVIVAWRRDGFRRARNWGGPALFPLAAALTMEVVPPMTANFSLRYVVPTIGVTCLCAALAFARPLTAPPADQPPAAPDLGALAAHQPETLAEQQPETLAEQQPGALAEQQPEARASAIRANSSAVATGQPEARPRGSG